MCPAVYNVTSNVLIAAGFDPRIALQGSSSTNGCMVVTPLPYAWDFNLIFSELYFTLSAMEWARVSLLLAHEVGSRNLHM